MSGDQNKSGMSGLLNRRNILKAGAGAAVGGFAASASAQVTGLMEGGGTVPFRLPGGAMKDLDRNQYISNMEVLSHVPGKSISGGEPLMAMWAKGKQRLLPSSGGWMDVSDPKKPVFMEAKGTGRSGGCVAYNTKLKKWLSVTSASEPLTGARPGVPHGRYHKEVFDKSVAYDGLRGIRVSDITNPTSPELLCEFSTGKTGSGTHMNYYDGGQYAYLDAGWSDEFRMENPQRAHGNGMMIVDMTDPTKVTEVARYHVPGQLTSEQEEYNKYWFADDQSSWTCSHGAPIVPKRVEDGGKYGYGGFGHFGMITFDLSDIKNPKNVSQLIWDGETMGGIPYHTLYPIIAPKGHKLDGIMISIPETLEPDCREPFKIPLVLDVKDPTNPRVIGFLPRPKPPKEAPYADFCLSRGRFGTHNSQCFVAPGGSRPEIFVATWFNAGIRVYDLSDPTQPKELAYFIPPRGGDINDYGSWFRGDSETLFVEWDRNIIWLGTHGGAYALSCPALGKPNLEPTAIKKWTLPHLNAGWDA